MRAILVVDDDGFNIKTIGDILSPYYKVRAANSVKNAFKALEKFNDIDLIVLDVIMPFVTGYDMIETIKSDQKYTHIPIVFISELTDIMDEYRAFELGAVDYIKKPVIPSVFLARVNTHVSINNFIVNLKETNKRLRVESGEKTEKFDTIKSIILFAITKLAGLGDSIVQKENFRVKKFTELLARKLLEKSVFPHELNEDELVKLVNAVPLHDIGMIGIHDSIVLKNGKYTDDEFLEIQKHTVQGYEALEAAVDHFNEDEKQLDYILTAIDLAHYHHEHWNGKGYPEGLEKLEIPLNARILAVADVFRALTSERNYSKVFTYKEAFDIIVNERGKQFDPDIVDAFEDCFDDFVNVCLEDGDNEQY